jgi:hypothetical protein
VTADFGPCSDWPFYPICDLSAASPVLTGYAATAATRVLWALSGRQFGTCTVTLRPCRRDCYDSWPWGWSEWGGSTLDRWVDSSYRYWMPLGCGGCAGACSCAEVSEAVLPGPVSRVVQVKLDGTPLATGSYRVDNNRLLVRTDGQRWPYCQNLNLDDTQAGTWSVTVEVGQAVPESGRMAMGELVCEIVKAGQGQDCRLPPGVTSLVRQGVTIQYPDVGQLLKEGRTGLYLVDLFLASENPKGLRQRARVYSVDRPTQRRTNT